MMPHRNPSLPSSIQRAEFSPNVRKRTSCFAHVVTIYSGELYVLTFRPVVKCPEGYPRLSAFIDSDQSFMIFRRFGYIQSRLILEKQDELRKLETELDALDEKFKAKNEYGLYSRNDMEPTLGKEHRQLMTRLEKEFREYGKMTLSR
jgi:hypothetical protein